jgi:predicted secreted protein
MSRIGHGSTLTVGGNAVGKIETISLGGITKDTIDVTNMASTAKYREFIAGLIDAGEVTFTTNAPIDFASDTTNYYSDLKAEIEETSSTSEWVLTFPNSANITFDAWTTNFSINDPVGDKITTEVTLKISGQPTFADS